MQLLFWRLSQHWMLLVEARETVKHILNSYTYFICTVLESREEQRAF